METRTRICGLPFQFGGDLRKPPAGRRGPPRSSAPSPPNGGAVQPISSRNRFSLRRASGRVFSTARQICRSSRKPFNLSLNWPGRSPENVVGNEEAFSRIVRDRRAAALGDAPRGLPPAEPPAPRSGPTTLLGPVEPTIVLRAPARFFYRIRFRTLKEPGDPACPSRTGSGRDASRLDAYFHRR